MHWLSVGLSLFAVAYVGVGLANSGGWVWVLLPIYGAYTALTDGVGNMVHYNALPGTYAAGTLYAPGTSDNWNGNAASTGFTAAVPS